MCAAFLLGRAALGEAAAYRAPFQAPFSGADTRGALFQYPELFAKHSTFFKGLIWQASAARQASDERKAGFYHLLGLAIEPEAILRLRHSFLLRQGLSDSTGTSLPFCFYFGVLGALRACELGDVLAPTQAVHQSQRGCCRRSRP
jgi:hypothetical protein